jgi:hypothetical protein
MVIHFHSLQKFEHLIFFVINLNVYLKALSSYLILILFPIFKKNFMKNIKKKTFTADALYLDERVGNE